MLAGKDLLFQLAANHVQRQLAGPGANVFPVAAKAPFHHVGLLAIGDRNVNQADGLFFRPTPRTGDASDADTKGCGRLIANSLGESHRYLLADRAVGFDHGRRNAGEETLEPVAVNYRSAQKRSRTTADAG